VVDVAGNTSTSSFSSESSCHLDVLSSSMVSSFPRVQDVTESNRLSLLKKEDAINDKMVLDNADYDTNPLREIMSMMTAKDIDKSALLHS
jgi:hypothetical protein